MLHTRLVFLALCAFFDMSSAWAQGPGTVQSHAKISKTAGGGPTAIKAGDQFGRGSAMLGDVNGDGISDLAVGALGDDDGGTSNTDNYGSIYIHFLDSAGAVSSWTEISNTRGNFTGALDEGDEFGRIVCELGDFDGDGVPDVAVGAAFDDDGGTDRGAVYLLFLTSAGSVKSYQKISDTEGGFTATIDNDDQFGRAICRLGDMDGNGVSELCVGSVRDDDGGTNRGAFFVLFMNASGTVKSYTKVSDTAGGLASVLSDKGEFGFDCTVLGDRNGDGIVDIAVASPDQKTNGNQIGAVFVCYLNANGTVKQDFRITEGSSGFTGDLDYNDEFGACVDAFGDIDGDGVLDLAVGAGKDDDGFGGAVVDRGAVWVLLLNPDATVKGHQKISNTQGGFTAKLRNGDRFGTSLCAPGDVNGDGVSDLFSGARFDDSGGSNTGAMYLLFLNGGIEALGRDQGGVAPGEPLIRGTIERIESAVAPAESLDIAAGEPVPGATLVFEIHDPAGLFAERGRALLLLATRPVATFTLLPGFGLTAAGTDGELLIDLSSLAFVRSAELADAAGALALARVEIPLDAGLAGLEIFAQGCWIDARGSSGLRVGLTDGMRLRIGR